MAVGENQYSGGAELFQMLFLFAAVSETPICTGVAYERRGGQKTRPGSAPERKLASVRSLSCPEKKSPRDAKETLRQAIRTLLTYSHR